MTESARRSMTAKHPHGPFPGWENAQTADAAVERLGLLLAPLALVDRESHMEVIGRVIETQVIPHLVTVHRARGLDDDPIDVVELTRLTVDIDPDAATVFLEARIAGGMSDEDICLNLLAPAARRLGALWEADQADFAQVTIGLLRLHRLLHDLGRNLQPRTWPPAGGRTALLAAVPGEQHTFGITMVAEFFRRQGWTVRSMPLKSTAELALLVRNQWFGVAALSAATDGALATLRGCIQTIRATSCNPAIAIIVGGPPFVARPELVGLVGADGTAADARDAALQADALLADQATRD